MTRREFLRRLGLLAGAACSGTLLDGLRAAGRAARPVRVVVVGAGLAGLCAAYELERLGHAVTVLEADPVHIGGRVRTLRFGDGLYGEAGAMRIPAAHGLTRRYAAEFGLELRPFVGGNPEAYRFLRGRKARLRDAAGLARLYGLSDREAALAQEGPGGLWEAAVGRRIAGLTGEEQEDLFADVPATGAVRDLDRTSFRQACAEAGLSEEAVEYLACSFGKEATLYASLGEDARETVARIWTQPFHEIVGGADLLPAAFARSLSAPPRLGCEVVRLEQDPDRGTASAVYREAGELRRAEGDWLLCTLPFPVLARLEADPPLSGAKSRAVRQLGYESAAKVLAVAETRFWEAEEGIYGGMTVTDLPIGAAGYPSDNGAARDPAVSAGPGVLLAAYARGQAARRLAGLPERARADLAVSALGRVHPQLGRPGMVRRAASWSWDAHPWSGGAYAVFLPGQHADLHRDVIAPEGRILFAGEHASLHHGWMQGGLDSALRAVAELLAHAGGA